MAPFLAYFISILRSISGLCLIKFIDLPEVSPMENTTVRLCRKGKACHLLGLFLLMMLAQKGDATDFIVGGASGWMTPPDPNTNPFNQWAQRNRFQVGDSAVFNYQPNQDSVLRVTKENYDNCNTNSPLESFSDGHTSYKFTQSGAHFFISGNKDHCLKNEKLWVVVMADRMNHSTNATPPMTSHQSYAPPPSPTANQTYAPPPSPTSNQTYSPPPPSSTGMAPSPPPTMENPSPPMTPEPAPPSAAPSINLSFIGSVGVLIASSLVLA